MHATIFVPQEGKYFSAIYGAGGQIVGYISAATAAEAEGQAALCGYALKHAKGGV